MKDQYESNKQTNRNVSINHGFYNESIKGDYIDNSNNIYIQNESEEEILSNTEIKIVELTFNWLERVAKHYINKNY